jgi:hypothetical protein
VLSLLDKSQATTKNSSSKLNELNESNEDSCATPTLAPSYHNDTQSSGEFDESELMDPKTGMFYV